MEHPYIQEFREKFVSNWDSEIHAPHVLDSQSRIIKWLTKRLSDEYEQGYIDGHESTVDDIEDNFELKPKY